MTENRIEAVLALRSAGFSAVGRDRIAMLEAIAATGSITAAARTLGYSYKTVWDAVAAINNLLPRPAVTTRAGGARGGSAEVTEDGHRLIRDFRRLENRLTALSAALTAEDDNDFGQSWWRVGLRTSARNVFRCTVTAVTLGPVNVEVVLSLAESAEIVAVITRGSTDELGIVPGREVMALVKSSFVMLATGPDAPRVSVRNRLEGIVSRRIDGAVNSDVTLDIGHGKSVAAVITRESADSLGVNVGDPVWALFDAAHVILIAD